MLGRLFSSALLLVASLTLVAGCGSSEDDEADVCAQAWDRFCACDNVVCDGRPQSCTGPDREWAECINAAANACTAACD